MTYECEFCIHKNKCKIAFSKKAYDCDSYKCIYPINLLEDKLFTNNNSCEVKDENI